MIRAISDAIGPERTAIRLSPGFPSGGIVEGQDNNDLYRFLAAELDKIGIAYLHILSVGNDALPADTRKAFGRALILNRPGRQREQVGSDVAAGVADMKSVGVMALANPDLVSRLKTGAPFNEVRPQLFYSALTPVKFAGRSASGTYQGNVKSKNCIVPVKLAKNRR